MITALKEVYAALKGLGKIPYVISYKELLDNFVILFDLTKRQREHLKTQDDLIEILKRGVEKRTEIIEAQKRVIELQKARISELEVKA